jgi:hypothetical protein
VFGETKDEAEERIREFVLARFPDFAAVDALQLLGADRQLEPPFGDDVYAKLPVWRLRLKQAVDRWMFGGTPFGMLRELRGCLVGPDTNTRVQRFDQIDQLIHACSLDVTDPTVDPLSGFTQTPPAGGQPWALQFDANRRWNTFIVLITIDATHPWHGGIPDDSSDQANQARRIIQRWRAGHAECRAIIVQDTNGSARDVLWGVGAPVNNGFGPIWGSFNWGQVGGAPATTVYWTPPSPQ